MHHILSTVRKTLARKEYSTQMIATIALKELAQFFGKPRLEWYLRYHILSVELADQSEIILLFQSKDKLLKQINTVLTTTYGYTQPLKDIRHKKMRSQPSRDGYD